MSTSSGRALTCRLRYSHGEVCLRIFEGLECTGINSYDHRAIFAQVNFSCLRIWHPSEDPSGDHRNPYLTTAPIPFSYLYHPRVGSCAENFCGNGFPRTH